MHNKHIILIILFCIAIATIWFGFNFEEQLPIIQSNYINIPKPAPHPKQNELGEIIANNISNIKIDDNFVNAWVLSIGHFKEEEASNWLAKLKAKGLHVYTNKAENNKLEVFIGPSIDKEKLLSIKDKLAKDYKLIIKVKPFNLSTD